MKNLCLVLLFVLLTWGIHVQTNNEAYEKAWQLFEPSCDSCLQTNLDNLLHVALLDRNTEQVVKVYSIL